MLNKINSLIKIRLKFTFYIFLYYNKKYNKITIYNSF
jgi:hypothetical protein